MRKFWSAILSGNRVYFEGNTMMEVNDTTNYAIDTIQLAFLGLEKDLLVAKSMMETGNDVSMQGIMREIINGCHEIIINSRSILYQPSPD